MIWNPWRPWTRVACYLWGFSPSLGRAPTLREVLTARIHH